MNKEQLVITRLADEDNRFTLGTLRYKDFHCFTLELPWKDNERNISCIPKAAGYIGRKGFNSKGEPVINIINVCDRSEIQIHVANELKDILGCIAPGESIKWSESTNLPWVTSSKVTLTKLLDLLPDEFDIVIR